MKRIVTLLLTAALLCLGASSCGRENPVRRLYRETVERIFRPDTVEAELDVTVIYEGNGITARLPVLGALTAEGLAKGGDAPRFALSAKIGRNEAALYGEGDWLYYTAMGKEGKLNTEGSVLAEMLSRLTPETLLTEGVFKSLSLSEEKGCYRLNVVLSGEALLKALGAEEEDRPLDPSSLGEVAVGLPFDENGWTSVMTLSFAVVTETAKTDVSAAVTFLTLGGEVAVTAPEGYETFGESKLDGLFP